MPENTFDVSVYNLGDLPTDFSVDSKETTFDPIPEGTYQVELVEVGIKDNYFYHPEETDPKKRGSKYVVNIQLAVIEDGGLYGRRLWDSINPSLKPTGKKGPTKLYKLVTSILASEFSWEDCEGYAADAKKFYENLFELIGGQVMVVCEITASTTGKKRNKILTYQRIKTELPKFDAERSKKMGEDIKAAAKKK